MINLLLVVGAYFMMEFVAWSNHKYVMHGFMWKWHRDHHRKDSSRHLPKQLEGSHFERNDIFFVIYALPAIVLIVSGLYFRLMSMVSIGIGITLYGLTYFVIHDVIIHQRITASKLAQSKSRFIRGIVKAHQAHHKPANKTDFNNYGLLIFPRRYFKS